MSGTGLPLLLWVAVVATVVLIDLTGYLKAAARAQQLADAAALAAVSEDVRGPRAAATARGFRSTPASSVRPGKASWTISPSPQQWSRTGPCGSSSERSSSSGMRHRAMEGLRG